MKIIVRFCGVLYLAVFSTGSHAQVITTFAGSFGTGTAAHAELNAPLGVALDHSGNIYVSEGGNNIIRKIAGGTATIVGGNGCNEYYGDGGPAVAAALCLPSGLAVDGAGNVYIADDENNVIRKVSTVGIITTVAGNGTFGFSGDNGPAVDAQLNVPAAVAVDDSGNIYIADENNNRIRKVNTAGIITTIAGNGSPGFSGDGGAATAAKLHNPLGVAIDPGGNVYVADMYNSAIRKITAAGTISTIAGNGTAGYSGNGGAAISAQLFFPTSVCVDGGGTVFIADNQNNVIRKVDNSGIITTIAGNGTNGFNGDGGAAVSASLALPYGVTVDDAGNVYIADQGNNRVRTVNSAGNISTFAGPGYYSGDGGPAGAATMHRPQGVATDGNGNFYIADTYNRVVRKVDSSSTITTIAGTGTAGNTGNGGPAVTATFYLPSAVAADGFGNVYVLDSNSTIRKINTSGIINAFAGTGIAGYNGDSRPAASAQLNRPVGIAADQVGNVYIADFGNNRIRMVDTMGTITTFAGNGSPGFSGNGGPAAAAQINGPEGVAVDNYGNVFIADFNNYMIRKVDTSGTISTIAGTGTGGSDYSGPALSTNIIPTGVGTDNAGNVFILNNSDDFVQEINPSGFINKIAGLSSEDYGICGENGIDSAADLSNPLGIATDNNGNIYIADEFNNRIRIIYVSVVAAAPTLSRDADNITVFPNPANDLFTVKLPATCRECIMTIYNAVGQVVTTRTFEPGSDEFTYNLNGISAGSYFVKVNTSTNTYRQKIVIVK